MDFNSLPKALLWYLIGYIVTDGSLSKDGRHIVVTSKDREHLFKIRDALGLTCKIGTKSSGSNLTRERKYSMLQFSNVKFYNFLLEIGVVPNKTLTMGQIKINDCYFSDFLRGVIDGDGCITTWNHKSNHHKQWTLTITSAAPHFSHWIKSKIEEIFLVKGRIYSYKRSYMKNTIYTIKFGKLASRAVLRKVYYNQSLCLERKKMIVENCLRDRNKMVNYGGVICSE